MRRIVEPISFAQVFDNAARKANDVLAAAWHNGRQYTALVCPSGSLLGRVAEDLDLLHWPEYLKIDAVFFEKHGTEETEAVAIEHESDALKSTWEMHKLCLLDFPLRVLITYPREAHVESLLTAYEAVVKRLDRFSDYGTSRRILVVFGALHDEIIDWTYHVYDGQRFAQLELAIS